VFIELPHEVTRLFLISSAAAAQYVRQRRLWWSLSAVSWVFKFFFCGRETSDADASGK